MRGRRHELVIVATLVVGFAESAADARPNTTFEPPAPLDDVLRRQDPKLHAKRDIPNFHIVDLERSLADDCDQARRQGKLCVIDFDAEELVDIRWDPVQPHRRYRYDLIEQILATAESVD